MHVNPEQNKLLMIRRSARIYFEPGSMQDHAERAVFELTKNTQGALLENKLARLRSFSPDPEKLAAAAREMTDYMKALISKHG